MSAETVSFRAFIEAQVREMSRLDPVVTIMPEPQECSVERAAMNIHIAVADFFIAVQLAQTNDDAMRIYEMIAPLVLIVEAAESAALNRADELTGKGR